MLEMPQTSVLGGKFFFPPSPLKKRICRRISDRISVAFPLPVFTLLVGPVEWMLSMHIGPIDMT